jgi:hypothetical protein
MTEVPQVDYDLFPFLPSMENIYCIEKSKNMELIYIGGGLNQEKTRKTTPVMIFDAATLKLISYDFSQF